jgi:two-component system sensor histidine kinase KdpD
LNSENRPNPEELLQAINLEENREHKGLLKIFIGMAAGVGKTYAMLEEAKKLTKAGVDVVIGTVETHNREETMALLDGIKVIPEQRVVYKGIEFKELDLDAIIKLKPNVVLIDELAHSNIPGLRHEKRWQDVVEILEHGINVYTTLNVQHIESLKDIVENISGIVVNETVPDSIVEKANSIRLIDITPDELLKRLEEGKVYLGDQSKIAARNFFKADKLTALREILLRYSALKIDHDLHHMVSIVENENRWRPREKLLVALSPSPHSQKLIRTTRRLAANVEAPWIAVYIDTGKTLSEADEIMLAKNLSLARDLGAEVITTQDPSISDAIQRIARRRGVTQIIVGRSPASKFFGFFDRFHLLDKLAKECTDIDIHVIRQEKLLTNNGKKLKASYKVGHFNSYLRILLCVALFAALNLLAVPFIGHNVVGDIFFIGILALSLFFKKGPTLFASILFGIIWYFFIIPQDSAHAGENLFLLFIYVFTAISTGILVDRYRTHQQMLAKREETSLNLYHIIRRIATASSTDKLFKEIDERLEKIFDTSFEIIIKQLHDGLNLEKYTLLVSNEKEKAAAMWVFENGKEAGWSTDTLPSCENLYLPLKGFQETVGVVVCQKLKGKLLSLDEKNFLYTVCQQLGYHIERSFLEERAKQNELLMQVEKINRSIIKRVSKELKPIFTESKEGIVNFKDKLKIIEEGFKDKNLLEDFIKIEESFQKLSHAFDHLPLMSDQKNE